MSESKRCLTNHVQTRKMKSHSLSKGLVAFLIYWTVRRAGRRPMQPASLQASQCASHQNVSPVTGPKASAQQPKFC